MTLAEHIELKRFIELDEILVVDLGLAPHARQSESSRSRYPPHSMQKVDIQPPTMTALW